MSQQYRKAGYVFQKHTVNKKLKKYSHKFNYLQIEEEEINEDLVGYKVEFDNIFSKYFDKPEVEEVWVNEKTGEVREEEPLDKIIDDIDDEFIPFEERSGDIKKLYKKLSIKTHPDKGGNVEEFQRISRAYSEGNLVELLYFAGEYELDFEVNPTDEEIIKENLLTMEKKLDTLRSTLIWVWNTGTKEAKMNIVKQIEDLTGHSIIDEVESLL